MFSMYTSMHIHNRNIMLLAQTFGHIMLGKGIKLFYNQIIYIPGLPGYMVEMKTWKDIFRNRSRLQRCHYGL